MCMLTLLLPTCCPDSKRHRPNGGGRVGQGRWRWGLRAEGVTLKVPPQPTHPGGALCRWVQELAGNDWVPTAPSALHTLPEAQRSALREQLHAVHRQRRVHALVQRLLATRASS
jgi:hypothetical protein